MPGSDLDCFPTQNPCAQCGRPIAKPIWSEHGRDRVSFVWSCDACNYQFTTIAIFNETARDDRKAA